MSFTRKFHFRILGCTLICALLFMMGCDSSTEPPPPPPTLNNTVKGTLTLPAAANGKQWLVMIDNDLDHDGGGIAYVEGTCSTGTNINYSFSNIPAGSYYILALVRNVSTSGPPEDGDYLGYYDCTLNNIPPEPNAVIPAEGTVVFDITLSEFPPSILNTAKGTLTLPAAANGKEWIVIIDTDLNSENGYIIDDEGICGSGTTVNYSFSNVPTGTYYIYALVRIVSAHGAPPEDGDFGGYYGGTVNNPPSNPNVVIPSGGIIVFDITLSVIGGTPGINSMSFNCTQGSFSASGEFDPNYNNDQGAGWFDAQTFAAYKVTSSTNMSLALLMFHNSIGTGSYSFPQQTGFGWALNFNPNDQIDYENKICILLSGETNVTSYSGNDIQGTFNGNGVFANNQSQSSNITNGLFSVNSTSSPYPALPENVRKIINRIKSKR